MIIATVVSLYKYLEKEFRRKADKVEIENILKELDKKVDKILYDRELDFIRKNIQQNTTTLVEKLEEVKEDMNCLLYTSPSPRDGLLSRMPSSA